MNLKKIIFNITCIYPQKKIMKFNKPLKFINFREYVCIYVCYIMVEKKKRILQAIKIYKFPWIYYHLYFWFPDFCISCNDDSYSETNNMTTARERCFTHLYLSCMYKICISHMTYLSNDQEMKLWAETTCKIQYDFNPIHLPTKDF